jgi:hypothetical protein
MSALLTAYGSSPTKQGRRTKADIEAIREAIYEELVAGRPMTVRQVFYRLVSRGAIAKTETEYKATVCRLLGTMRLARTVPFNWIADNTRWMRKPKTYSGLRAALSQTARTYRRALWDSQPTYAEVWLEKDALAGVLYEVTESWDVPLMVTRGYPSLSYLYEAAEAIGAADKPAHLYYFGDYDPSGLDIARNVEDRLGEFAPWAEIHFERVAVTPEQVAHWGLPTRPTKLTDSRSPGFLGESIEVDAIPPDALRDLVRECIERHIDRRALAEVRKVEREERTALDKFLGRWEAAS